MHMKYTDDYNAKFEIWARESRIYPPSPPPVLPYFGSRKFNSYEEFNAWKRALLEQVAVQQDAKWKS